MKKNKILKVQLHKVDKDLSTKNKEVLEKLISKWERKQAYLEARWSAYLKSIQVWDCGKNHNILSFQSLKNNCCAESTFDKSLENIWPRKSNCNQKRISNFSNLQILRNIPHSESPFSTHYNSSSNSKLLRGIPVSKSPFGIGRKENVVNNSWQISRNISDLDLPFSVTKNSNHNNKDNLQISKNISALKTHYYIMVDDSDNSYSSFQNSRLLDRHITPIRKKNIKNNKKMRSRVEKKKSFLALHRKTNVSLRVLAGKSGVSSTSLYKRTSELKNRKRSVRRYSANDKERVINLYRQGKFSHVTVAEKLDIPKSTVSNWLRNEIQIKNQIECSSEKDLRKTKEKSTFKDTSKETEDKNTSEEKKPVGEMYSQDNVSTSELSQKLDTSKRILRSSNFGRGQEKKEINDGSFEENFRSGQRKYTLEEKNRAREVFRQENISINELSKKLDIPPRTLRDWIFEKSQGKIKKKV